MTSINGYVDNYTTNKPARYNGYPTFSGIVLHVWSSLYFKYYNTLNRVYNYLTPT